MRFIGSHQLQHEKDLKDRKIAIKDNRTSNAVVSFSDTVVSFGTMTEDRGRFTVTVSVTKDFSGRPVTKTIILPLT